MGGGGEPVAGLTNWAGNLAYRAERLHEPESVEELQGLVAGAGDRPGSFRVIGSRHSFNAIADTAGDLISLRRMPRLLDIDPAAMTVTVDGGVRYGEFCATLDTAGYAIHNLASLPHISVAGAIATATHGSGDRNGNLATAVARLELVTPDGERRTIAREVDSDFDGAVVGLGALGVVTAVTLDIEPSFRMRQDAYEDIPLARVAERFDEISAAADSVSLFTDWRGPTVDQIWCKRRLRDDVPFEPPRDLAGARLATVKLHPIRRLAADSCTEQLGVEGPWYERMPHFRMDHAPSSGAELQSEYFVPRDRAAEALLALDAIRDTFTPVLQISEIRTVAADRLWLSTTFGRETVALHFSWTLDWKGVREVLPVVEAALASFDPRPHWGKLTTIPPEVVRAAYPRHADFAALARAVDPNGTFRNEFVAPFI